MSLPRFWNFCAAKRKPQEGGYSPLLAGALSLLGMIQVYSYPRSGTNFLLAALGENFDFGCDLAVRRRDKVEMEWGDKSQVEGGIVRDPYGRLFANHRDMPKRAKGQPLYIYRDGRDVLYSQWRSYIKIQKNRVPFNDWINRDLILKWYSHVHAWATSQYYCVTYEWLMKEYEETLLGIQIRFNLTRKYPENYRRIEERVGWAPNKGIIGAYKEVWSQENLRLFDALTRSFRIYA